MNHDELVDHIRSLHKLPKPKKSKAKKKKADHRPRCGERLNAPCDGKPKYCTKYAVNRCYRCNSKVCKGDTWHFMGNKTCFSCYDYLIHPQSGWLPERA